MTGPSILPSGVDGWATGRIPRIQHVGQMRGVDAFPRLFERVGHLVFLVIRQVVFGNVALA